MNNESQDRELVCVECQTPFIFSAGEQRYFADRGFENLPKRCKPCREVKKQRFEDGATKARRQTTIKCSECGQPWEVPFTPRGDEPVYCKPCFDRRKAVA